MAAAEMNPAETLRWLTGLRNLGSRLGVDRMRVLSDRLGQPERAAPCFHIAGTNGKGSTSAMIEAIQRAHGRLTGLYTSPHLVHIGERIQLGRAPLKDAAVVALAEQLRPHYEAIRAADPEMAPTFFELITAAALIEFRAQKVDVAVLETGLGGRLDATNICSPEVCVITSIGFDHQEYLGDTLAQIAAEKAGILKPGVPCVVGDLPADAEAAVVARAREVGAPLHFVRDRFAAGLPETNLSGAHQRRNAGAAWLACELAGRLPFVAEKARWALQHVEWPGRWQELKLADGRRLIIDGSHNEEGVRAIEPLLGALPSPTVVLGALSVDRGRSLLRVASRHAARLVLVRPDNERALAAAELAALLPADFKGEVRLATVAETFPQAGICVVDGEVIVVLGSLYLVGEVLARFHGHHASGADWQDRLPGRT
ncbi:MAG: Mur ligase family protein [Verrucomicrobiota bacterium]